MGALRNVRGGLGTDVGNRGLLPLPSSFFLLFFLSFSDGWIYRRNGTEPDGAAYASSHWEARSGALGAYASNVAAGADGFPTASYSPGGWSPLDGCALVKPCSCAVSTDHTAINCTTVEGAGAGAQLAALKLRPKRPPHAERRCIGLHF